MSSLIGLLGIAIIFLPFFIFEKFEILHLMMICIGFVFLGIARANNISVLSSQEPVGDELIRDFLKWVKNKLNQK